MSKKPHIIIIGAGPGGLTAGMLLSHRGCRVSVYESRPTVGGRNAPLQFNGYTFDTGPTFLMMKFILEQVFEESGRNLDDYLNCVRLDPLYRLKFSDHDLVMRTDPRLMKEAIRDLFPGEERGFDKFLETEKTRFENLYPCIQRDYSHWTSLLAPSLLKGLPHLSLGKSVFANLGRYFRSEKLKLAFTFQAKYLGMSPWECPAFFTMLPLVEHKYGIYHVMGGLHQISLAMAKVIGEHGGTIHTSTPVKSLILEGRTAKGVILQNGERIEADAVVVNADFGHAMTTLVEPGVLKKYAPQKLDKKEFSCSTFMMYLGLNRQFDLNHHTIVFANDYKTNVQDIFTNKVLSNDVSFYLHNASVTDPSLAPEGHSALYVLVPVPNQESKIDWEQQKSGFREKILHLMETRAGLSGLRESIVAERIITPADWNQRLFVYKGATFNLSHRFSQLLYLRPRNKFEELNRVYLVGGGTHPGSGLPTIYESARISSNMISSLFSLS